MPDTLDMSIYLNGERLTNYSHFKRVLDPNETDVRTLGGTLYTDFLNTLRTWQATWDKLFRPDFDVIYKYWLWQYQNNSYPILLVPAFSLSVPVKISMSDQDFKYNALYIENFILTATEQYAFS